MRKPLLLFLLVVAGVTHAQVYTGDSWAAVQSKGAGTLSLTYVETPSFAYKDKAGQDDRNLF